jgi:hypothetical protein
MHRSHPIARKAALAVGVILFLLALYSAGGALQAAMLFTGEWALRNWNFWASLPLVFAGASAVSFRAFRRQLASPNYKIQVILAAVAGLLAIFSAYGIVKAEIAIDRCLDAGRAFEFTASRCDLSSNHPYIPFLSRSGLAATGVVVVALFALWFAHSALNARRRIHQNAL